MIDKELKSIYEHKSDMELIKMNEEAARRAIEGRHEARKKKVQKRNTILALILAGSVSVGVFTTIIFKNGDKGTKEPISVDQTQELIDNQETLTVDSEEDKNIVESIKYHMSRNDINSELNMINVSKKIGSLIFDKEENEKLYEMANTDEIGILNQCSFRTQDNEGYGYNLTSAASKLLELKEDETLFYYAFCGVINDMGNNMNNKPADYNGRTNAEELFFDLKVQDKDGILKDYENLEDFYSKNQIDGDKSFKKFKESQDKNAEYVLQVVEALKESKEATL